MPAPVPPTVVVTTCAPLKKMVTVSARAKPPSVAVTREFWRPEVGLRAMVGVEATNATSTPPPLTIATFVTTSTCTGSGDALATPSPSSPSYPAPKAQAVPFVFTRYVLYSLAAIDATPVRVMEGEASTCTGVELSVYVLFPSWSLSLRPQHTMVVSDFKAQA